MFILRKVYSLLIDTIQTILLATSVFLVIYIFLFRPFQVNGQSMYPNFEDQEYVLTKVIGYSEFMGFKLKFSRPKRGDVIVFKAPHDPEKEFIKRVIGLPGDSLFIQDGVVYVNNKKFDESSYLGSSVATYQGSFLKEKELITIKKDTYFVMGDNRIHSSDSREWGLVGLDSITGESLFVYWPVNKVRAVKNPY